MSLLHAVKLQARKLGIELHSANFYTIDSWRLGKLLKQNNADVVLDIGANVGQFAHELFDEGKFRGEIVSFEPLPDAHRQLTANAVALRAKGRNWRVAPRMAVGSSTARAILHVAGNSVSSSLMPMADSHVEAASDSGIVEDIAVDVRPLGELVGELDIKSNRIFLKIDTQGTERDVLAGAMPIMDRIAGIKLELSLTELYRGQSLYHEMDRYIRELGFQLWDLDVMQGFRHPSSAKLLQFDGIYFR